MHTKFREALSIGSKTERGDNLVVSYVH